MCPLPLTFANTKMSGLLTLASNSVCAHHWPLRPTPDWTWGMGKGSAGGGGGVRRVSRVRQPNRTKDASWEQTR
jgi:hypothetical protein